MAIVINGSGTVTGLAVGGLPDGTVDTDTLANTTVTAAKVAADVATQAEIDAKLNLAGGTMTGTTVHGDNVKDTYGASADLEIYHDGSHNRLQCPTGELKLRASAIRLGSVAGENGINMVGDGAVELYHNNAKKIETNATGVAVTGLQSISGTNTTAVSNGVTMWGARGLTVNSNSGEGSDNIVMGAMQDSGRQFIAATNGAGTANYGLILNPIGGEVFISRGQAADLRIGNWVANGTGQGVRLNTDGNQGQISVETHLTSSRQMIRLVNGNGQVGAINTSGSATSYNTSSDYRLKENVDYTWDATTRLKQLKPARFNFIADDTNTLVDGFIAHEVSSVVPEAIHGVKDAMEAETFYTADDVETQGDSPSKAVGDVKTYSSSIITPQGIDQSKLVPLLVKTIQELEARITALEA